MAPPKLKLYMDIVSPFGYIAYWILRHDPVFANCEITYIPIFLGGVMKACGNTPPINIKNKNKWIEQERKRWAKTFNVPMKDNVPEGFPPLTLTAMRGVCALTVVDESQEVLTKVLDELLRGFWVEHRRVWERDCFAEVLEGVVGGEVAGKVMEMLGKEGKEVLAKNSDLALQDGAFGLPWFVATNGKGETESFWGVDHMGQLTAHLGLEKPKVGGWKSML